MDVASCSKWKAINAALINESFNYAGKKPKKRISHYVRPIEKESQSPGNNILSVSLKRTPDKQNKMSLLLKHTRDKIRSMSKPLGLTPDKLKKMSVPLKRIPGKLNKKSGASKRKHTPEKLDLFKTKLSPLRKELAQAITTSYKLSSYRSILNTKPGYKKEESNVLTPRKSLKMATIANPVAETKPNVAEVNIETLPTSVTIDKQEITCFSRETETVHIAERHQCDVKSHKEES